MTATDRSAHRRHGIGVALMIGLALAACAPAAPPSARAPAAFTELPGPARLPPPGPQAPARSLNNADLARDFMELSFILESGRPLPRLTRFEGPITLRLADNAPTSASPDLDRLLARLRTEAGIDIARTSAPDAAITVEFLPRRAIRSVVPNAACFVVPGVRGWNGYRRARGTAATDWASLDTRRTASIFIPADTAPQEIRDCLHEEIAQALGPLNDLYRLPQSVFNDDNFHAVLTRFDMMILRATYAPELRSGMTAPEVAARLPAVLARLNPSGGPTGPIAPPRPEPRALTTALERALRAGPPGASRRAAARQAVSIASAAGWADTRTAFAWFVLGRLSMDTAPDAATDAFLRAAALYRATPGTAVQTAHVDMQLAAIALSLGQPEATLALTEAALPAAQAGENAALIASLLMIRAEALLALGQSGAARQAVVDSQVWARYGFGAEAGARRPHQAARRARDLAALAGTTTGTTAAAAY